MTPREARTTLMEWRRSEPAARDRQFLKEVIEKSKYWEQQGRPVEYHAWSNAMALSHVYRSPAPGRVTLLYVYIPSKARRQGVGRNFLETLLGTGIPGDLGFSAWAPTVAAARLYRSLGAVPLKASAQERGVFMRRPWDGRVAMAWPQAVKWLVSFNWETFNDRPAPEEAPVLPAAEARVHGYRVADLSVLTASARAGELLGRSPRGVFMPPLRVLRGTGLALTDTRSQRKVTYLYQWMPAPGGGQWFLAGDVRQRRREIG